MDVCEVTAPPAGDQNLLPNSIGALKHGDTAPAFAGLYCAEKSCGASAKNQGVKVARQE
jgi:hypothetical protein